ncbi:6,7-dimethyl-8-ribityllumazine synthase [Pseudocercospora fuligena]|uniref:6,7-dimethyl-8-ribityllumazine synthase n=1 Tax=Pseudocercospora fuligena TaxID=685502 RepID=A0A8H6VIR3_9PEZI|nr:6,7-dimethyl-8-ribityllumazine synthase [Pseudocercospora fuligena]
MSSNIMATANGIKRKRVEVATSAKPVKKQAVEAKKSSQVNGEGNSGPIHIQIVTGSYERTLHGISATIPQSVFHDTKDDEKVEFHDTFLFAAHASAIRCLAISPAGKEADKRFLATGSSDERINVYSLSTAPPPKTNSKPNLPSLSGAATAENPRNKSLGSLIHHDRAITRLHFLDKNRLFSAAEDATICISRTRDWTVLTSLKAPIPKPQGRPSGDTAGPGEIPAGVNDFAIHPSQKLMLTVGRGEKCIRLWNLMTGKKAQALNFERELLSQVGESKFSSGEGRRVIWDQAGENYVVAFERGAAVFGIDCKPKAVLRPGTKIHQMRFMPPEEDEESTLAVSTEDGRVILYDLLKVSDAPDANKLQQLQPDAEIGGRGAGTTGRIKDFDIIELEGSGKVLEGNGAWLFVAASSDGAVRLWSLPFGWMGEIMKEGERKETKQVGKLIATKEAGSRITCLGAFLLDGQHSALEDATDEMAGAEINGRTLKSLKSAGVKEENIVIQSVPGSYELPYAVQRMYTASQSQSSASGLVASATDLLSSSTTDLTSLPKKSAASNQPFDAIIAIGALIKGSTMHFEYISDAVSHGLMRVQLDTGAPVVFGLLTLLTEEQGLERAGIDAAGKGHNHGEDWGAAAVELGVKRKGWTEGKFVE